MNNAGNVRDGIVQFVRRELIGPDPRPGQEQLNDGDEVLRPQDPPRLRYSAGILFPSKSRIDGQDEAAPSEIETAESGPAEGDEPEDITPGASSSDTDDTTEHEVNRANEFLPSAMGLTALVRLPKMLKITVRAAYYTKQTTAGIGKKDKNGEWQPHHYRKAISPPPLEIERGALSSTATQVREFPIVSGNADLKLVLHLYSRPYIHATNHDLDRIITFTLINKTELSGASPKDSECLFQCEFAVEGAEDELCFLEYPESDGLGDDVEEESLRLLYRHRKTFAIGHGCAAQWSDTEGITVGQIKTNTLPIYEIRAIVPRELDGLRLSMLLLSDKDAPDALSQCQLLASEYKAWINQQAVIVASADFPEDHKVAANRHLDLCRTCLKRIIDGIELLASDADTRQAFAWMNRAMLEQQLHYDLASNPKKRRLWVVNAGAHSLDRKYEAPDISKPPEGKGLWRPFQLAFILMNLRSMAEPQHADRGIVDLIWFPTGGGKTEAYLGLTAFTIFRRRLHSPADAGTTILMRYTLRLLTTQQFQRAASLICACEIIRRENEARLGAIRVSVGLWVGQTVTPNKNSEAVKDLETIRRNGKPNPFIVLTCPWCGAQMGPVQVGNAYYPKGYRKEGQRVVFRCEDPNCDFQDNRGIPLLVVDETIYEERPTLLIGTVDKFALLPWYPSARGLFGLSGSSPFSPPDLIIQDELHLISGALGSMVGMYEVTIDALCRRDIDGKTFSAKIIASTATICQAPKQIHSLYARDAFLFPPQGLRAGDSFFAEEADQDRNGVPLPGRLYMGVFASALSSHVTAQVRVVSALLQAVKCIPAPTPDLLDPYWTLMIYFNSLRELGHAATLIKADIREHLNAVWDRLDIRKPTAVSGATDLRRFINRDMELTSRIQSNNITDVLQQLFNPYPGSSDRKPVDVCLATNMIQVGLDVPRLGLMAVVGQPKTTSEYIQATSRVGRDPRGPGLVVAVLNPAKPRDRSHYEHFRSYHQSIYRWVEPTSVTPFTVPVRERALHAQVITLSRYWGDEELRKYPRPAPSAALIKRIRDVLIDRIRQVDSGEAALADQMLSAFMARWQKVLPGIYGQFGPPPQETPLIYPSGTEPRVLWAERAKATPSSMRNVDSGCDAHVILQFPLP